MNVSIYIKGYYGDFVVLGCEKTKPIKLVLSSVEWSQSADLRPEILSTKLLILNELKGYV
ncbi:hypothetical protein ACFL3Q_04135 [Planctomycetota bacterium]